MYFKASAAQTWRIKSVARNRLCHDEVTRGRAIIWRRPTGDSTSGSSLWRKKNRRRRMTLQRSLRKDKPLLKRLGNSDFFPYMTACSNTESCCGETGAIWVRSHLIWAGLGVTRTGHLNQNYWTSGLPLKLCAGDTYKIS